MKKAVLMSIHPQWCEKIFSGEKTIEIRRTRPSIPTPFKVLVYETKGATDTPWVDEDGHFIYKGRGEVIGSFVCDRVTCCQAYCGKSGEKHLTNLFGDEVKRTCLAEHEMFDYIVGKGKKEGTGWLWNITEPTLFDKPRELDEFYTKCDKTGDEMCGDCLYLRVMLNSFPCDDSVDTWCGVDNKKPITRPPQSWCYVEEPE